MEARHERLIPKPVISIVIPVRNDADGLQALLRDIEALRGPLEVIVVDGGSSDASVAVAAAAGVRLLETTAGRGRQLQAGVSCARGDWIWMLHADTRIPIGAAAFIAGVAAPGWGRFDVRFDDPHPMLAMVSRAMNLRSAITGICTGDQGIFVHRRLLRLIGGVPVQPLMEDIQLSRHLKRLCNPTRATPPLTTAARRWLDGGIGTTIVWMWWLRLRYWWGVTAQVLADEYYG